MSKEFKPQPTLRSTVLKNALKAYVVPPFSQKYQVVAVRCLWSYERSPDCDSTNIWSKRRELEFLLANNDKIVAFFSSITALQKKQLPKKRCIEDSDESEEKEEEEVRESNLPGLAFWVVFDWPTHAVQGFEERLAKQFMSAGLNLLSCKAIRGRGIFLFTCCTFYNSSKIKSIHNLTIYIYRKE